MATVENKKGKITPADVLSGAPQWPKEQRHWEKVVGDNEIVFEDKHVVVFHDPVDDEQESQRVPGEIRCTLIVKDDAMPTLMDLGITDETLNAHILHGIQQAAYALGLQKHGFEVRSHVYPPLQHRPELTFKLRAGKPPKPGVSGDL
ncbi:MAG: hypothetical protein JO241_06860 [Candidatus Eremiobacteraeota bacterium]|nr:hypothetical protein [Candidatus Eremiobacteraeota bacterium]